MVHLAWATPVVKSTFLEDGALLAFPINCWQSGYCYIQSRADRSPADNCAPDVSSTSHGRWNTTRNADCAPNTGGNEAEQGWVDIDLGDEVLGVRHAPVTTRIQLANVGGSTPGSPGSLFGRSLIATWLREPGGLPRAHFGEKNGSRTKFLGMWLSLAHQLPSSSSSSSSIHRVSQPP